MRYYAVVVCPSVCLSVCHKLLLCQNHGSSSFLTRRLPSTCPTLCNKEICVSSKIRVLPSGTVSNSGLRKFCHSKSIALSAKLVVIVVDSQVCWQHLYDSRLVLDQVHHFQSILIPIFRFLLLTGTDMRPMHRQWMWQGMTERCRHLARLPTLHHRGEGGLAATPILLGYTDKVAHCRPQESRPCDH